MQVEDSFILGHARLLMAKVIFTGIVLIVVIQAVPAFVAAPNQSSILFFVVQLVVREKFFLKFPCAQTTEDCQADKC